MEQRMNAGGLFFMTLAWGFVIGLFVYCFYRMFKTDGRGGKGEGK